MDEELIGLEERIDKWEGHAFPLITEIKIEVTKARQAMDSDPPALYELSNSLVDLSILNIRLIERIIDAKYLLNEARYLYESRREEWKVKLVQGYDDVEGIAAGVADSMKVGKVKQEHETWNQAERNYEDVNLTRRAIEKSLDAIRSKLSYEKAHET